MEPAHRAPQELGHGDTLKRARRAIALTVAICMPSLLNAKLSSAEDGVYGGVYSNACGDRSQPMVRLYGDVMSVERAGTVVTAKPFRADAKHLGAAPPADFKTAYIGEVKGGDRLVFVLFHNKDGLFVLLEGGPKSLAPLGPGVMGQSCATATRTAMRCPAHRWRR